MKKYLLLTSLFCFACKKQLVLQTGDVVIHSLSIDYIKAYIQGNWRVDCSLGGITGSDRVNYSNSYIVFGDHDQMVWNYNDTTVVNCKIDWVAGQDIYYQQPTYLLYYTTFQDVRHHWVVDQIRNDTLYMKDNVYDGFTTLLTRK